MSWNDHIINADVDDSFLIEIVTNAPSQRRSESTYSPIDHCLLQRTYWTNNNTDATTYHFDDQGLFKRIVFKRNGQVIFDRPIWN
jgi:hypothetical protein